jgi:hypothetical protein
MMLVLRNRAISVAIGVWFMVACPVVVGANNSLEEPAGGVPAETAPQISRRER